MQPLSLSCCTHRGNPGSAISMNWVWLLVSIDAARPTVMGFAAPCQGIVQDESYPKTGTVPLTVQVGR